MCISFHRVDDFSYYLVELYELSHIPTMILLANRVHKVSYLLMGGDHKNHLLRGD